MRVHACVLRSTALATIAVALAGCVPTLERDYRFRNPQTGEIATCAGGYLQWSGWSPSGFGTRPARGAVDAEQEQISCMTFYRNQGWVPID